jgi:hypothetical protein
MPELQPTRAFTGTISMKRKNCWKGSDSDVVVRRFLEWIQLVVADTHRHDGHVCPVLFHDAETHWVHDVWAFLPDFG